MFVVAVSEGCELRLLEECHVPALHRVIERNYESLEPWFAWAHPAPAEEDTRAFVGRALRQFAQGEGFHCGIWIDGNLAGSIGLHRIDWQHRHVSLGYWLDAAVRGRGLMTACCRAVLNHVFGELALERVEIRCATGNTKSCAIPERLGFRKEGVLRRVERVGDRYNDLVVWSLLREEWKG
ncbi:MAG: GNAT family N-acetyltransferase [Bryobacterales bacterium]|nr:GNAT family N-acetyltransferase [Bryobacterales bacterium]